VPWGSYDSYSSEKAITSSIFLITYLLPLLFAVFCYSTIVHALKRKVTPRSNYRASRDASAMYATALCVCLSVCHTPGKLNYA